MDLTLAIEVLQDEIKDKSAPILTEIRFNQDKIKLAEEKIREHQHKLEDEIKPFEITLERLRELNTVCEKCKGIGLTKQYCEETDSFEDDLCEDCQGIGDGKKFGHICAYCNGIGRIPLPNSTELPDAQLFFVCKKCEGSGVS